MAYAAGTDVSVERSLGEIITLVKKAGAQRVAQMEEPGSLAVQFFLKERMIRFRVRLPDLDDIPTRDGRNSILADGQRSKRLFQMHRQRARALLLVIKAKLESAESGVETFEEAFLANVVMADGATLYERLREPIALEYQKGAPVQMLLSGPMQ